MAVPYRRAKSGAIDPAAGTGFYVFWARALDLGIDRTVADAADHAQAGRNT